ncbi:MAG: hypothetical protein KC492_18570, partial [Myxococcales bacterium]|nr:hypothetical protein [Myxococcales bacterium]
MKAAVQLADSAIMQGIPVFYAPDAERDEQAFAKLAELAERAGKRALVVCGAEHLERIQSAALLDALELSFEHLGQSPAVRGGVPALAYQLEPPALLELLEDRRVSVVI